jgi:hypothetical protein
VEEFRSLLSAHGIRVEADMAKYSGGHTVRHHGRTQDKLVDAIQVEFGAELRGVGGLDADVRTQVRYRTTGHVGAALPSTTSSGWQETHQFGFKQKQNLQHYT